MGLWWGDHGRWLSEIQRFAQGEVLYRDFTWPFPPLALWLLGSVARITGTGVGAISAVTALLFLLLVAVFYQYSRRLVSRAALPLTIAAGLLLAFAYAMRVGAPLPLGTYTPAAPLGSLLLLGAALVALELIATRARGHALALGVLCGFCVLTKQDFWIPALFLIVAGPALAARDSVRQSTRLVALASGAAALVVLPAVALVVASSDWAAVSGIVGGFGRAAETVGRGFPSWSRLTIEAMTTSWLLAAGLLYVARGRPSPGVAGAVSPGRWSAGLAAAGFLLAAVFTIQTYRTGLALHAGGLPHWPTDAELELWFHAERATPSPRVSLGILRATLQEHLLPLFLPIAVLVAVLVTLRHRPVPDRHGSTLVFLLGLCIAARARRLFEGVDWYHFLLEFPVYVAVLQWYGTSLRYRAARVLRAGLIALVLLGGYSYWKFGVGPGTSGSDRVAVRTAAGLARMSRPDAKLYRVLGASLERLDPSGARPLFGSGYIGGFAYFLGRPNASGVTESIRFSQQSPADVIAHIRRLRPPPILLDNRILETIGMPTARIDLNHWESRPGPNWYLRYDRPWFNRLEDCPRVVPPRPDPVWKSFDLHDCQ